MTVNESELSYTFYLEPKTKYIWAMSFNDSIGLDEMKAKTVSLIKPAKFTKKKKFFIETVANMESKLDIAKYVSNSVRKAKETEAK